MGEEFTGTKGVITTSGARMVHYNGPADADREEMRTRRDITIDAIENFPGRILTKDPENAVERSALSTCIAMLGRTAIYTGRQANWKSDIGIS